MNRFDFFPTCKEASILFRKPQQAPLPIRNTRRLLSVDIKARSVRKSIAHTSWAKSEFIWYANFSHIFPNRSHTMGCRWWLFMDFLLHFQAVVTNLGVCFQDLCRNTCPPRQKTFVLSYVAKVNPYFHPPSSHSPFVGISTRTSALAKVSLSGGFIPERATTNQWFGFQTGLIYLSYSDFVLFCLSLRDYIGNDHTSLS